MQRIIVVLLFVIAFLLGALVGRQNVGAQAPKYQISGVSVNCAYLLETATGRVWVCSAGSCDTVLRR
jgi:hypothetical protein